MPLHRSAGLRVRPIVHCSKPATTLQDVGVFQLYPNDNLSLLDIRDAVETCDITASPEERKRCFETFGLDAEKVDRYYYPVVDLEEKFNQDDDTGRTVAGVGGLMFSLIVVCKLL